MRSPHPKACMERDLICQNLRRTGWWAAGCAALLLSQPLRAKQPDPAAVAIVQSAVNSELQHDRTDHDNWMYREHDVTPGKNAVYQVVETPQGSIKRTVELNGNTLSGSAEAAETSRINSFIHDSAAIAKQRRAGQHDDQQATELLKMLPQAFLWQKVSEDDQSITLKFEPNPDFDPPDMQSRVMGQMAGDMIIAKNGNRIQTLKGHLTDDVLIGWGILGRLKAGGTFDIERRQLAPNHWDIVDTHVHISGHALFFKTIGSQEDDTKTDIKPSTAQTLEEAARLLGAG